MAASKSPEIFLPAALLAIARLIGEFTVPEMAEKLTAMGVPAPTVSHPRRVWAHFAAECVKRGLLVKTSRSTMINTNRMNGSTERAYYYARTDRTDVRLPPRRLAEAEKLLAQAQPQTMQP